MCHDDLQRQQAEMSDHQPIIIIVLAVGFIMIALWVLTGGRDEDD